MSESSTAQEQLEETVVTYEDGSRYSGLLRNGKQHGQGTLTYNGAVYKGQWEEGKKHGQGTFTSASGEVYKGEWKEGKYHGQGTFTLPNGEFYTGQWKDDKFHGQGTLTYNGVVHKGQWEEGKKHGQGTFTYSNGDIYEGGYMDDKQHGQGKLFDAQGNIIQEGVWAQGVFIVLPDEGVSSKDCSKLHARPSLDHPTDSDSSALTTAAPTAYTTPTKSSPEPEPLDPLTENESYRTTTAAGGGALKVDPDFVKTRVIEYMTPMSLSSATRKYLADADVNAAWERSQLNVVRQIWSFETQLATVYPALLRSFQPEQLYDFLAQVSALGAPGVVEGVSKEVMLRCPSDLWHRFFALLLVRVWNETASWVEGRALLDSLPQGVQDHVKSALEELRRSATPDSVSGGLFSAPIWYPLGSSPSVAMHPYDIPLTPLTAVGGALHYLAATNCPTASDMAMKMTQLYALLPHGCKVCAPCTGGSEKVVVRTEESDRWLQKVFDVAGLGQVTAELVQKISETTVNVHASVFGLLDTVTKEKEVSTLLHQAADLWVKKAVAAGSTTDKVKIECQKEALSAFLAAAAINPTNVDVLSNAAHMSIQLAPAIKGKTESLRSDAKVFTEDALQRDPVHLHALQLQASLHLQNKNWVQAGTVLEKLKAAAEAQFPQPTSGGAAAEPPLQQQSARAKEIFDSYAKMEKYRSLAQQQQHQEPASTGGGETKPTKHDE